jgi:DNA-binding GntR family transcriptional regulator
MALGAKALHSVPDMMLFFNRAGGSPVLAALLQTAMAQPDQQHAAIPYADVGDRFGVSRTHVRQLLVAAEEAGLVKQHARGGHRVEILPRLWSSHDRALAGGMYLRDMIYVAAARQQAAAEGSPEPERLGAM